MKQGEDWRGGRERERDGGSGKEAGRASRRRKVLGRVGGRGELRWGRADDEGSGRMVLIEARGMQGGVEGGSIGASVSYFAVHSGLVFFFVSQTEMELELERELELDRCGIGEASGLGRGGNVTYVDRSGRGSGEKAVRRQEVCRGDEY